MKGYAGAILGLIFLQAVVGSDKAAGRLGGIFTTVASWIADATDPSKPLLPDKVGADTQSGSSEPGWFKQLQNLPGYLTGTKIPGLSSYTAPIPSKVTTTTGTTV